jgi:hypothetical protein
MKERRRGPLGRATGLAEGVAAAMRRGRREREPRVLVYDGTGFARLLQPESRGYDDALDAAERMLDLVEPAGSGQPEPGE